MTFASAAPPGSINLLRGWPADELLPADLLRSAAHTALSDPSISIPGLDYGPDAGYEPLREAIAEYLTTSYNPAAGAVDSSRITITGGASQNLANLLAVYTDPSYTRAIWVVAPTYYLAFGIFQDAGFSGPGRMRAVREDEEGLDLQSLEEGLRLCEERIASGEERGQWEKPRYKIGREKVYKHVIYSVPTFSNPSGRTLSQKRREGLVRLARKYDALIVCDDVYDFLHWRIDRPETAGSDSNVRKLRPLPRVVDIDRRLDGGAERAGADGFGNAVSNGSFSKIVGPGVRVGWCEGTPKLAFGVSQTGCSRSGGAPSQLTSTYITILVTSGALHNHITQKLQPSYASRYTRMRDAIQTYLIPHGFTLLSPTNPDEGNDDGAGGVAGGFFIWIGAPRGLAGGAKELAKRCATEEAVVIAAGEMFEVPPLAQQGSAVSFSSEFRVCFAWEDEERLVEGIRRIGAVAERMEKEDVGRKSEEGYVIVP